MNTGILLRNKLLMVGVKMWVKVYSPNVVRAERRARRGKMSYMRWIVYPSFYRSDIYIPFLSFFPSFFLFLEWGSIRWVWVEKLANELGAVVGSRNMIRVVWRKRLRST